MKFKSKLGLELILFITFVVGFVVFQMLMAKAYSAAPGPFLIYLLIFFLYKTTYYEINNRVLIIKSGYIVNYRIDINQIIRIRETYNPLSSPALTLDRLEIKYGNYKWVLISPKEKELFISEILKINPNIEIIRRKNSND